MASVNFETLASLREVQGQHGPGMCMASSKFLALKIIGLVDGKRHLSAFLNSDWAKKHGVLPLVNSWGWTLDTYNEPFNRDVLPAALNEPTAGVKNPGIGEIQARYVYFRQQITFADQLLQVGAPLVVAVGVGGPGQDHHIVVVRGTDGNIWAVDPWPGPASKAVKKLPSQFSFSRVHRVEMALGELHIPCASQLFGYYRDADPESRHIFTVQ
jgi:hypothetical protein